MPPTPMYTRSDDLPVVIGLHLAECIKEPKKEREDCIFAPYADAHTMLVTREEKNALFMLHKLIQ